MLNSDAVNYCTRIYKKYKILYNLFLLYSSELVSIGSFVNNHLSLYFE